MALSKPKHPGHVRGAGQGPTISNYFHTSRRCRQGIKNDEVARLVEARLQKERKIQEKEWNRGEDEWRRREDDFRAFFVFEIEKMWWEFQMSINPPSYPSPYYTSQSGIESCSILKDLSKISEVILFNICTHIHIHTYTPTYLHAYLSCLLFWLYSRWVYSN